MAKKSLISLLLILTGCTHEVVRIQKENVPVLYCPKPPVINRPNLAIDTITDKDTDGDVVVKYEATIKALQDYSKNLETIVDSYNKISQKP
jgi:hypothetical protein